MVDPRIAPVRILAVVRGRVALPAPWDDRSKSLADVLADTGGTRPAPTPKTLRIFQHS